MCLVSKLKSLKFIQTALRNSQRTQAPLALLLPTISVTSFPRRPQHPRRYRRLQLRFAAPRFTDSPDAHDARPQHRGFLGLLRDSLTPPTPPTPPTPSTQPPGSPDSNNSPDAFDAAPQSPRLHQRPRLRRSTTEPSTLRFPTASHLPKTSLMLLLQPTANRGGSIETHISTICLPMDEVIEVEREETQEVEAGGEGGPENAEDTDKEEEHDEVVEEEDYTLQFEGVVDPLNFVQERDQEGIELYQHFERLEYETLAKRKRKALQQQSCDGKAKKPKKDELLGVTMEEIEEMMNFGCRRKARTAKKRGRKKGIRNKLSPEVNTKIGDATLHHAAGNYKEAIPLLEEAVQLAPNISDSYYVLSLVYDSMNDRRRALNFLMIAAHLSPKDVSLWKKLIAWSIEQKNSGQIRYCLTKAIAADPKDIGLRFDRALLYFELAEYQKAADSYDQIISIYPANAKARKMAAMMYHKCGQLEKGIEILENYFNDHPLEAETSVLDLLISFHMENSSYNNALKLIEKAQLACGSEKKLPFFLKARKAICSAHHGNIEIAEDFLQELQMVHFEDHYELVIEVADTFLTLGHYGYALKLYFIILKKNGCNENQATLHLKIGQCYLSSSERVKAIPFYYKALEILEADIDARITLSSLLIEEGKEDEAISLLSPLKCSNPIADVSPMLSEPWYLSEKVKMQLAKIYQSKGRLEEFVNVIFPPVQKTLLFETMTQRVKTKKRLSKSILSERVKLLDNQQEDSVFGGFKPVAASSELAKAIRAKKSLEKKAALREEQKLAALSAGMDWECEDSDDDAPKVIGDPPLPGLLKNEDNHQLLLDLCNTLASLHRYAEALEIINYITRLPSDKISADKKEALQFLGAKIAYYTPDPKHAYNYARNMVQEHPYNISAWNSYYEVILRFQNRFGKHLKFLHRMRIIHRDSVPPMIINGNQCTMQSMHQAAAEEYLLAYKLQPENPLINLCVGTALINLALGFRLQNKHQCVVQGFAFLYNYLRICNNNQESLYNLARAYQHVGLVTLAALYYEKVLAIQEKDYPPSKLPNQAAGDPVNYKPGYCNLHMEAAFNLHLIYKKSGAVDLARSILKKYCSP